MKLKFLLIFLLLIFIIPSVRAVPHVSFTMTSRDGTIVFSPTLNAEVTHYKWDIIGKGDSYDSHTDWIPYVDRHDHVSIFEDGTYYVTLLGRNTTTGGTNSFTNELKVSGGRKVVVPEEEVIEESIGSLIINKLPEPLKSFMLERSEFELFLMVFGGLFFLAIVTRRKKVIKYIKLERFNEKD